MHLVGELVNCWSSAIMSCGCSQKQFGKPEEAECPLLEAVTKQ
jgi:hypothetical protein